MTNTEKVARDNSRAQERNSKSQEKKGYVKTASINQKWKDGKNYIRPVGNFYEVHTHNLSPNSFGSIGVAPETCFKGKDYIPFEVLCIDWNLLLEMKNKDYKCPFCKLYYRASKMLKKKGLTSEEKKQFEAIKNACKPNRKIKWNVIDRNEPWYIRVNPDKKEEQIRGLKVASFSPGLFKDIKGIFEQTDRDLADPENGIDIVIDKSKDAQNKISYTALAAMDKITVRVTPLTDEEKSWPLWDIIKMYDKPYDFSKIEPVMHEQFKELLSFSDEEFAEMTASNDSGDDNSEPETSEEEKGAETVETSTVTAAATDNKKKLTRKTKKQEEETETETENLPF